MARRDPGCAYGQSQKVQTERASDQVEGIADDEDPGAVHRFRLRSGWRGSRKAGRERHNQLTAQNGRQHLPRRHPEILWDVRNKAHAGGGRGSEGSGRDPSHKR